jgi:hypothetical protein
MSKLSRLAMHVQFMPLPTLMFSGGHSYFVQHQAAALNSTPFYAHACLVPGHVPAKVCRGRVQLTLRSLFVASDLYLRCERNLSVVSGVHQSIHEGPRSHCAPAG